MATDKLKKLEQQRELVNQKIRREKTRLQGEARRKETRRKILDGSLLQELMKHDPTLKARIEREREKWLTRPDDRALYDLPPLGEGSGEEKGEAGKPPPWPTDNKATA